jgi:hypothetical protein
MYYVNFSVVYVEKLIRRPGENTYNFSLFMNRQVSEFVGPWYIMCRYCHSVELQDNKGWVPLVCITREVVYCCSY